MKQTILIIAGGLLLTMSGCSTYSQQNSVMHDAWQTGDGVTAAAEVGRKATKSAHKKDELIWLLEQGTILSTVGDLDGGLMAFNKADDLISQQEAEAKLKVGAEAVALFTNQATLPYSGTAYDKIMLSTYKALDYLHQSNVDAARVELNRGLQRQRDAVADHSKKIEKTLAEAEKIKSPEPDAKGADGEAVVAYDVARAQQDEKLSAAVSQQMQVVDQYLLPYADYVNPFSVFVDGLFFSHLGLDNADLERGRKSFERVKGMSPGGYISADYAMAEALASGQSTDAVTYILFATGSAPSRTQTRFDIPLFLLTDEVSYVGASFPALDYHKNYIPEVMAHAAGKTYVSELLCDMDAIISRDFKNEWPVVMTKTLVSTATKAIAGQAAEKAIASGSNDWKMKLAAKALNIGAQAATNIADLRSWVTLPKKYSYIRIPTPESGHLSLTVGAVQQELTVAPGAVNIVMVRSVSPLARPIVSQFKLKIG